MQILKEIKKKVKELSDSKEHETSDRYLGYEEAIDDILQIINDIEREEIEAQYQWEQEQIEIENNEKQ